MLSDPFSNLPHTLTAADENVSINTWPLRQKETLRVMQDP